jgi:hypothetical protein
LVCTATLTCDLLVPGGRATPEMSRYAKAIPPLYRDGHRQSLLNDLGVDMVNSALIEYDSKKGELVSLSSIIEQARL